MKKTVLAFILLVCPAMFAQTVPMLCTSVHNYRVNNNWTPSQSIPYGMVMDIHNSTGSGCDVYITRMSLSAGTNLTYIEFGSAFAAALMPGCSATVQVTDLDSPLSAALLPMGVSAVNLPCGNYVPIGTVADGRWSLAKGAIYEENFTGKPRKLTSGMGYTIWTSPGGYPSVLTATGDLTITLDVKTCPAGSSC